MPHLPKDRQLPGPSRAVVQVSKPRIFISVNKVGCPAAQDVLAHTWARATQTGSTLGCNLTPNRTKTGSRWP